MLRLWLYLAGVEASNYKSVEEVHAALVIPGMHEVIVVMSVIFYLLPYVDRVCTQLSAQLLIQCMSNLVEYKSSQTSPFWKTASSYDSGDKDFSTIPFSYGSLTIFLSRLTRFWMSVLSVMSLPPRFMKTTSGR